MNSRFIDWIWHVRGSLALGPGQTSDEAFDKLAPLFQQRGTTHQRTSDTLTFRKKNQPSQDKMAVWDDGTLRIEHDTAGAVLRYHLTSRMLLFCFLAPLLFLGFAGMTIALGNFEKPPAEAAAKPADKKHTELPQSPIDKFLGAPVPEKPKKDNPAKHGGKNKELSPTPAYVFAVMFAVLYGVGRILEARMVRALFRKCLLES